MELQIIQIQNKIREIHGQNVMFDFELAELYQVKTKQLNQSVKRNLKRFPADFMFQLTTDEWEILKSQFVTSSWGGVRKMPFVFTEQGVAMLSGLLNSDIAIRVNIDFRVRTFGNCPQHPPPRGTRSRCRLQNNSIAPPASCLAIFSTVR